MKKAESQKVIAVCICCMLLLFLSAGCENILAYVEEGVSNASTDHAALPTSAPFDPKKETSRPSDPVTSTPAPVAIEAEETPKPSAETTDTEIGYYYSFLTDEQKTVYREIKDAFDHYSVPKHTLHTDCLEDALIAQEYLMTDYAKYYYNVNFDFSVQDDGLICLELTHEENVAEIDRELSAISEVTDEILRSVPADASEYETIRVFYEWLCDNLSYEESDRDQIITSAFIDRKTVCTGYARAFQYLCNRTGIQCALVRGDGDNGEDSPERHAWNFVRIDGKYYWVDATWGDPIETENPENSHISYFFLCTTDSFLFRTHTPYPFEGCFIDQAYSVEYPKCDDESLLFCRQFGLFFEEYDPDLIERMIINAIEQDADRSVVLQFRNPDDMQRFVDELLPDLLQSVRDAGMTEIYNYQMFSCDRDGYMELTFLQ